MDARPGWLDHAPTRRHSQFSPYYTLDSVEEDAEAESLAPTAYEASTFSTAETLRHTEYLNEEPIPIISPKPQSLLQMEPRTYQCECTERECIHYLTPHVRGPIWMPNEHQQRPYDTDANRVRTCTGGGLVDDGIVMGSARLERLQCDSSGIQIKASSNNAPDNKVNSQSLTPCPRPTREANCGCELIPCVHGHKGGIRLSRIVPTNPGLNGRRNIFGRRRRGG